MLKQQKHVKIPHEMHGGDNMKKIVILLFICCLLSGCKTTYERDTSKGEIIQVTLDEAMNKMEQGDEFIIAFETDLCSYCQQFHSIFDAYIENHHVELYQVMLDEEARSESENLRIINHYFPTFSKTPGVYYAKGGYVVSSLTDQKRSLNEDDLEKWVVKHALDEKK